MNTDLGIGGGTEAADWWAAAAVSEDPAYLADFWFLRAEEKVTFGSKYGAWLQPARRAAVDALDRGARNPRRGAGVNPGCKQTASTLLARFLLGRCVRPAQPMNLSEATRRSRTGDLLITKLARRFSVEYCSGSLSAAEARCVMSFSPSLSRCG